MCIRSKPGLRARDALHLAVGALWLVSAVCAEPTLAQDAARQRAQLMQLQQQVQRLQQENDSLQAKARQESDRLKKESEAAAGAARRSLTAARADAAAKEQEAESLRGQLEQVRAALAAAQADNEQLRAGIAQRDEALAKAADRERQGQQAQALLGDRLKQQTGRADLCETKHAQAMQFASSMVDRYEKDRLRLCEPVTGLWKVHNESRIQELRDQLSGYRLDVPAEAQPH